MPILTTLALSGAVVTAWKVIKKRSRAQSSELSNRSHVGKPNTKKQVIMSSVEAEAAKQQHISIGALASFGASFLISPWFAVPGLGLLLYGSFSHLKKLTLATQKNKSYVSVLLIDVFVLGFAIYTRLFFVASILFLMMATSERLIAKTEREAQTDFSRIFGELSNTAWLLVGGVEREVSLDSLEVGDIIVVHVGEMIPVDGRVTAGEGLVDQHLLTGESQPIEKKAGDSVLTSTLVLSGALNILVEKQGKETVTGHIAQALQHASTFKSQMQSRGDQIVEKGASRTLLACAVAAPIMGFNSALALGYSGFGYQMRTAAPLMVLNYLRIASGDGILIKDGRALEKLSMVDTIIFDKTGTLTEEVPKLARIVTCSSVSEQELLQYAASAEQRQTHPIAQAICQFANEQGVALLPVANNDYKVGHGLRVVFTDAEQESNQQIILIGSRNFIGSAGISVPESIEKLQEVAGEKGHSLVYVAMEKGQLLGVLELQPTIRQQAQEAVTVLHELGMDLYIISGDQERPTRYLSQALGIDHYFAETLPEGKASIIEQLQKQGRQICFIGDGINDSVALQKADVSISLHGAATIAQDTADIVLMTPDLMHLPYLIRMGKALERGMDQSMLMNNAFGVTCVSGVLVFGMGLSGAVILYSGGLLASIALAMLPLLKKNT